MSKSVVTVGPSAEFRQLWKSIFSHKFNALPVVDKQKKLIGIITREDLLEQLYPDYEDIFLGELELLDFEEMEDKIKELAHLTAKDLMSKRVIFTHPDTPIMRALSRMIARRVGQLPVLTDDEKLIGMITKGDVFASVIKKKGSKKK